MLSRSFLGLDRFGRTDYYFVLHPSRTRQVPHNVFSLIAIFERVDAAFQSYPPV
jgi:hypothetical protein